MRDFLTKTKARVFNVCHAVVITQMHTGTMPAQIETGKSEI